MNTPARWECKDRQVVSKVAAVVIYTAQVLDVQEEIRHKIQTPVPAITSPEYCA